MLYPLSYRRAHLILRSRDSHGSPDPDDDNDGIPDAAGNCALVGNSDQLNTDGDAFGNACDPDDDNDGVPDAADNCQFVANPSQSDIDGDGEGDVCEAFTFAAGGSFVVGNLTPHAYGQTVTFWGGQWAKNNSLSGGGAPSAFKGFENSAAASACGGT